MTIQLGVFNSKIHCNQWRQLSALNGTDYWLTSMPVLMADGWASGMLENRELLAAGKPRRTIRQIIETNGITTTPKDLFDALDGPERFPVRLSWRHDGSVIRGFSRVDVDLMRLSHTCDVPDRCFLCQYSDGYAVMIERAGKTIKGGVLIPCLHTEWTE